MQRTQKGRHLYIWGQKVKVILTTYNIFVVFGGKVFQQIVGIPMGTNCAPLLADIFLYSYEAEFIQSLLSTGKKKNSISVQLHIQIHR